MSVSPLLVSDAQIRSIRIISQGLHGGTFASPAAVMQRSGFVRTMGGVDAYLATLARQRHRQNKHLDDCLAASEVQVIPAVRGSLYVAARADVPLCLRIAQQLSAARTARELENAGFGGCEIDDIAEAALDALTGQGPLTTDNLGRAIPEGLIHTATKRGKMADLASPLPPALRQLELEGHIERIPQAGRLDTDRYEWRRASKNPFLGVELPTDPARLHAQLLQRYLAWTGAATLQDFQTWSGLTMSAAKAALQHVDHVTIRRDDGSEALGTAMVEDLLPASEAAARATAMLSIEDNLVHLCGFVRDIVDPELLDVVVPGRGGGKPRPLSQTKQLSFRGLIADGGLVGFWEYDPDARVAIPFCLRKPSKSAQLLIEQCSATTSSLLRDEIGHGRSFPLDTEEALRGRLAQLRRLSNSSSKPVVETTTPITTGEKRRQPTTRSAETSRRPATRRSPKRPRP